MSEKPRLLARRMSGIEPFQVMELLARAKNLEAQGRSIVHMEIGEPDFATPRPICEAAMRALQNGETFYTAACGLPALREAIGRYYSMRYGVDVSPERIVVTSGSSAALLLTLGVLVNPGDQVVLTDPGYPANRHFVRLLDGTAVNVPVNADSNYQMTPELLEYYWSVNTVAALLASPSNPTGTLIPAEHLRQMAGYAARRSGVLIVDEIYHGLVYESVAKTALELDEDVFVINSFSKYFNMTGWRLGWVVAPATYVREIDKLAQNIYLSPSTPAQHAALVAFEPDTLAIADARRDELRQRRDYLVPQLRELGFDIPRTPEGAFYVYAGCSQLTNDSYSFAMDLLEEAGVAITPGIDFGAHRAAEHVRFAYTAAMPQLKEGVTRIRDFLAGGRR
jgi:aspartate/methionine/tyrosine aminotransferase